MALFFKYRNASPPDGWYEYAIGDEVARERNRFDICRRVREMHEARGLPVFGDGFTHVMEYMCPRLPDGFCNKPSNLPKPLMAAEVKERTVPLFYRPIVPSDAIERRLETCVRCPAHTRRGFCADCSGIIDWMLRGFGGRRGKVPADNASGVCYAERVMAAALASVDAQPRDDVQYPEGCWLLAEKQAQKSETTNGKE